MKTCTFPDCDRPYSCKGLCAAHYNQRKRRGLLAPLRPYTKPKQPRTPKHALPDGWHTPTPKRAKRAKAQAHSGDSTVLDTDTLIAPQLDDATRARARAVVISHGGTDLLDMLGLDAA